MKDSIESLNNQLKGKSLHEILALVSEQFSNKAVLASSLGLEDQVLTHAFLAVNKQARIFVIDTGRLHQETYDVMAQSKVAYGHEYEVYTPQRETLEALLAKKGPNSFYESVENRKECCYIRKVEPLSRALAGVSLWITGLRKEQSQFRGDTPLVAFDEAHNAIKLNPLIDWSIDDVWQYIKTHEVPYNTLHDKQFPSIGCAPCTRAIESGEDDRAGRWWWEKSDQKECGLHVVDGKLVRKKKEGTNDGLFG